MTLPGYDAWKLQTPYDDENTVGDEEGQECGRYPEPDGDEPRGWKPKPCKGVMDTHNEGGVFCPICGEQA